MQQGCVFSCTVCALDKGSTIRGTVYTVNIIELHLYFGHFPWRGMSDFNKNIYIMIIFGQLEVSHLGEGMTSSNSDTGATEDGAIRVRLGNPWLNQIVLVSLRTFPPQTRQAKLQPSLGAQLL